VNRETLVLLAAGLAEAYFLWRLLYYVLSMRHLDPWRGYSWDAIKFVAKRLANEPEGLTIALGPIEQESFLFPIGGKYEPTTQTIYIETRLVRTPRRLIKVLLHEICHHNQCVDGRAGFGHRGWYWTQPIEMEARAFARAWGGVALRMYNAVSRRTGNRQSDTF